MGSRHRAKSVGCHIEGDQRRLAPVLDHGTFGCRSDLQGKVERGHPFRQILAEAADVTDRKCLRRRVHGEIGMTDAIDLRRCHDRPRAGAIERHRQFRLPPELRQQGHDQAGAMGRQHREHELYRVRQLHADHGIDRQARFDEMGRKRRNRPVGLGKGHSPRRLSGDAGLVDRIEQRRRVGLTRQNPLKQSVERRRYVGLDHGIDFGV